MNQSPSDPPVVLGAKGKGFGLLIVIVLVVGLSVGLGAGLAVGKRASPPARLTPRVLIATGVQDAVTWRQYAWTDGADLCMEVEAGASASGCGGSSFNPPFWAAREVPVTTPDSSTPARSEIVFGAVSGSVVSVRVLGANHQPWDANLERCPCGGVGFGQLAMYSLAVTRDMAFREPDGSYAVTVVAYEEHGLESARIRVPLINIGYCATTCAGVPAGQA